MPVIRPSYAHIGNLYDESGRTQASSQVRRRLYDLQADRKVQALHKRLSIGTLISPGLGDGK